MRIKIISDGTAKGTAILNAETGELVSGVTHVEWCCGVENPIVAEATLKFKGIELDVIGTIKEG